MPKNEKNEIIKINKSITIVGKLIGMNSKKGLENISVSEEHNPLIIDQSVDDGTYILEKISIPENKIISLVVTYPDGTLETVNDIDVSQFTTDNEGRLMLPNKEVREMSNPKTSSNSKKIKDNRVQTENNYQSNDKSQQINIPENKGTINVN